MDSIGVLQLGKPAKVSQGLYIGLVWGGFTLATVSTGVRFAARYHRNGKLFADDALVAVAWLIVLASSILFHVTADELYLVSEVLSGRRPATLDLIGGAEGFGRALVALTVFLWVELWVIKVALLVFFRRLYRGLKLFERLWYASLFLVLATGVVCVAVNQYRCFSGSVAWVLQNCFTKSSARYRKATLIATCCLDLVSDAIIIALPVYMLWGVRISLRRKLVFGALFSVTLITMAVAIARVIVLSASVAYRFDLVWVCVWTVIEINTAMIVAGLASFRSLFIRKDSPYGQREAERQNADANGEQAVRRSSGRFFAQYMGNAGDLFSTNASRNHGAGYDELSSMSQSHYSLAMESIRPEPVRELHR